MLRYALAGFLQIPPEDVRVVEKRAGSTIVVLEVPQSAASILLSAFDARRADLQNALQSFGLEHVCPPPQRDGDLLAGRQRPVPRLVTIGRSVVIDGELSGHEDLTVEGKVAGRIELREHILTIGPHGKVNAAVFAKSVIVLGEVVGNIIASERVDIRDNGSVDGDIVSPRVGIAEGAHFRGSVDMQRNVPTPPSARAARPAGQEISVGIRSEKRTSAAEQQ